MRSQQKSYETPTKGWDSERIEQETDYLYEYGLTEKRELWKAESKVRNIRREARKLNAVQDEQREDELVQKLASLGLITADSSLTAVLDLTVDDILDRRLQTIIYRKGLANTMKQARQYLNHGHITINDQVVDVPGYMVSTAEESEIEIAPGSKHLVTDQDTAEEA